MKCWERLATLLSEIESSVFCRVKFGQAQNCRALSSIVESVWPQTIQSRAYACTVEVLFPHNSFIIWEWKLYTKDYSLISSSRHRLELDTAEKSAVVEFNGLLREIKTYYLQKLTGKQVNINLKIAYQEQSWCLLNVAIKKTLESGSSTYSNNTSMECWVPSRMKSRERLATPSRQHSTMLDMCRAMYSEKSRAFGRGFKYKDFQC